MSPEFLVQLQTTMASILTTATNFGKRLQALEDRVAKLETIVERMK